ncbi:hypothetical protein JX265_009305 [Neoarthrinium moseri]|uniref:Uncharacterized protein n=1 Tax=Neoarthrinium moseri TaxID=1658444 RepID=A0A9Q0AMN0_9PEZI|nr:hypothetical protein JX265_009305 [Neoarthrinium moseri]
MYIELFTLLAVASHIATAQDNDAQTLARYEDTGECYWYNGIQSNSAKSKQPCEKWCHTHFNPESAYGCTAAQYGDVDLSIVKPSFRDDDGLSWIPATCQCDGLEFALEIFDVVAQGLEAIDLICKAVLSVLNEIAQIGLDFVPGAGEAKIAYQALVKGAKTFSENAFEAADFFGGWVGPACGDPGWSGDIFTLLTGADDSFGTSVGCVRRSRGCNKAVPKRDGLKKSHVVPTGNALKQTEAPDANSLTSGAVSSSQARKVARQALPRCQGSQVWRRRNRHGM